MAKKSKSKLNIILYAAAVLFAILAVCMIFTNVCGVNADGNIAYVMTGVQATFGYSEEGLLANTVYTSFSFMNMLVYVLLIAGIVLAVLRLLKVLKSGNIDFVAALLFIVAGILYFLVPNFVVYGETVGKAVEGLIKLGATKVILIGSIVGGISSVLAGIAVIASKITAKK